jgi:hypothetical protein
MSHRLQRQEQPQALPRPVADADIRPGVDTNELKQAAQVESQATPFFDRLLARLRRFSKTQAAPHDYSWHNIIWREWRHTQDQEYAQHLFALVGEASVGTIATLSSGLMGIIYGGLIGLFLTLIGALGDSIMPGPAIAAIIAGAVLGGLASGVIGFLREGRMSWRTWLAHLTLQLSPIEFGLLWGVTLIGIVTWMVSWLAGFGLIASIIVVGLFILEGLGVRVMIWLHGLDRGQQPDYSHRYRAGWFWWRHRPYRAEIETALRRACAGSPQAGEVWGPVLDNLEQQRQYPRPPERLVEELRNIDWVERFTASQLLVTLGGAAVPHLQAVASQRASILRRKAIELLRLIERETATQLADRCPDLLCPRCLTRCDRRPVTVADELTITYYGCRSCGQSHDLWPGVVVAVLDADMPNNVERADPIRVNWLSRRFLFDFDEVEIVRATDEDVERFVVQVGNDTDSGRRQRYRHMPCRVRPACRLSENTRRVLASVFETVVQT